MPERLYGAYGSPDDLKHALDELAAIEQPKDTKPRTWLEIAGVNSRETVISDLFAYYLDAQEDHEQGRLFVDCLLDLVESSAVFQASNRKREDFDVPFHVHREKHRIDVLLTSAGSQTNAWNIVIENKLRHGLHNPFAAYLESASACFGVLLTLHEVEEEAIPDRYVSITHKQLINRAEQSLGAYQETLPQASRQMLMLTEFIQTMKNHTEPAGAGDSDQGELLIALQSRIAILNRVRATEQELQRYIKKQISQSFESQGFKQSGKYHYVYDGKSDKANAPVYFRFYVEEELLTENPRIAIFFELYDGFYAKHTAFQRQDWKANVEALGLKIGEKSHEKYQYYHLAYTERERIQLGAELNLRGVLSSVIDPFFKPVDGIPFVQYCQEMADEQR